MTTNKTITANFTATASACAPALSGLVSWWPGAGNANDIIGNNNGTLQNGATNAPGKVGQAFSFDGLDDNVSFPDSSTLSITGPLSIEAWIKPNSLPNGAIVTKYDNTLVNGASYLLAYYPSFGLRFIVYAYNTDYRAAATITNAIPPNAFAHVAATFNPAGQVMKLYVNGVEIPATIEPGSTTVSAIINNQAPVRLGALVNGSGQLDYRYSGLIDEVGLYSRELSTSEIQAIYTAGSVGRCLTPVYITSVNKSGNNLNLSWLAQQGVTYQVQYKTNLTPATPWTAVGGDVTATNTLASKTDVVPANAPQRFYRVEMFR